VCNWIPVFWFDEALIGWSMSIFWELSEPGMGYWIPVFWFDEALVGWSFNVFW